MQKTVKYLINNKLTKLFSILSILFCSSSTLLAQSVLVAGTTFTPTTVTAGKTYYSISDISQYGLLGGVITITPVLTPNTNPNIFNSSANYAITTNPDTLDNTRYENLSTDTTYKLIFSPPNFSVSPSTILSYTVNGLAVGSNVSVAISYCNVSSTTKVPGCLGQTYPLKGVVNPDAYNTGNGTNTPR